MRLDTRLASGLGLNISTIRNSSDIGTPYERKRVASLLAEIDASYSVGIGKLLTKDPDPTVRREVALKLGAVGYMAVNNSLGRVASNTISCLKELSFDDDWHVRHNVALGALTYGSTSAFSIVEKLLNDPVKQVRAAAFKAYVGLRTLHPNAAAKLGSIDLAAPNDSSVVEIVRDAKTMQFEHVEIMSHDYPLIEVIRPQTSSNRIILSDLFAAKEREEENSPKIEIENSQPDSTTNNTTWLDTKSLFHTAVSADPFVFYNLLDASPSIKDKDELTPEGGGDDPAPPDEPPDSSPPGGGGGGGESHQREYVEPPDGKPLKRYVNSWFTGHPNPLEPLIYGKEYELGIEVYHKLLVGSYTTKKLDFSEPDFNDQEWLDVAVAIVTDDFEVLDKPAKRMRLPKDLTKKSSEVTFSVRPIKNNWDSHITVLFYHQNNLFHEALIGARVQVLKRQEKELPTAYFQAQKMFEAAEHGPRDVSLQLNRGTDSYRLVLFYDFGGDDFDVMWCKIPVARERIAKLLEGVRDDLIKVVDGGNTLNNSGDGYFYRGEEPDLPLREKRLPELNHIDDDIYSGALQTLARAGTRLYVNLFYSPYEDMGEKEQAEKLWERLKQLSASRPLKIQVLANDYFIPWNLLYDGNHRAQTINPSDFWGFKHTIEEIPYRTRENKIDDVIDNDAVIFSLGMNINRAAIPAVLTEPQLKQAQKLKPTVQVYERFKEDEVLDVLQGKEQEGQLEYFYCHAGVEGEAIKDFDQSYIALTSADTGLTLEDIKLVTPGSRFTEKPIVFLNACESAYMDGRFYDGFVPKFLDMGARAVLGTDCKVPSLFGAHFGAGFLDDFLRGGSIGDALLAQRINFLKKYQNPLGLIYRVFGNADVRLSKPVIKN